MELSSHDEQGTTFEKIIRKYALEDPSLDDMGRVIHAGVAQVLHHATVEPDDRWGQIAAGLLAISEGMMLLHDADDAILQASFPVYDALYANLHAHALVTQKQLEIPDYQGLGPTLPTRFLRQVLNEVS